jgi:hypothetical protein
MKGKYKVPVFVGLSLVLVALLIVAMIIVAMIQAGSQDLVSKEIKRSNMKVARNIRHPQGEIIELAGPSSLEECERFQEWVQEHKDDHWFKEHKDDTRLHVGMYVQEFYYARDLRDEVLYRDIHQDGTVRIGVISRDVIEEFKELGIPITFEIIDLDEVRHLEEAAREIDENPYVELASYSYSKGRIEVILNKPNWCSHKAIYQEYPDYPLLFWFTDFRPE